MKDEVKPKSRKKAGYKRRTRIIEPEYFYKYQWIIAYRMMGMTYKEIGRRFNVTRERIRQILESKAPELASIKRQNAIEQYYKRKKAIPSDYGIYDHIAYKVGYKHLIPKVIERYKLFKGLAEEGLHPCEIARRTGIHWATVLKYKRYGIVYPDGRVGRKPDKNKYELFKKLADKDLYISEIITGYTPTTVSHYKQSGIVYPDSVKLLWRVRKAEIKGGENEKATRPLVDKTNGKGKEREG